MEEHIYFTLITNKYLAHAKVLIESFSRHNRGRFVVGLIDKPYPDLSVYDGLEIVSVESINISEFDEMKKIYNVIELLTACKPFYFRYLMQRFQSAHSFVYLDSDMYFYGSIEEIIRSNGDYSILLTPHFCSPQPDDLTPSDHTMLTTGVFNLGFLCINRFEESVYFNDWWCRKLTKYCYADTRRGYFTDQLWINFATTFLANFKVLRNLGLNVSNWNLHERTIHRDDMGEYVINNSEKLLFYHFSNFNVEKSEVLAWYNNRYSFRNRPEMRSVFEEYVGELRRKGYDEYKLIEWAYQFAKKGKWAIILGKVRRKLNDFV